MIFPSRMITAIVVISVLVIVVLTLAYCSGRDSTKPQAQTANATGKALDNVTAQTPIIRQEQQEKQHAVDEIQGSADRLPDGYGADLQRLRDGKRRNP